MLAAEPLRAIMQRARDAETPSLLRAVANVSGLALILVAVFAAYAHTLNDWFVSDDFWYLRASQLADAGYFANSFDFTTDGPLFQYAGRQLNPLELAYRPLYPIWFLFTYKLFGLNPWQYKLFALALHMFNTTLVWLVAKKLTGRVSVAAIAAFIFGIHPSYAAAVYWISSISVQAMAFSLPGVLLFLHYLDGGPRRQLCYVASFACVIVAMLLHPESIGTFAVLVLAYLLWRVRTLNDLRAPRLYLPVVPQIVLALVFLGLHQYIREHNDYQQLAFKFGPHMVRNYLTYVAYAGNPFDPTGGTAHWREALPIVGVGLAGLYLLFSTSLNYRSRLLVLAWFALALVPLTTFTLGIHDETRKLYFPGPAFALIIAMSAVSGWDWLSPRLRPFSLQALDVRYVPVAGVVLLVAVALPLRTWQITDQTHMAEATLTHVDSQAYKGMIDQVRQTYPALPEGARLDLTGVPWPLQLLGVLDSRTVAAIQVYYGETEVIAVSNPWELPPPNSLGRFHVGFTCPPVCGPPVPTWLRNAVWQAQHPGQPLPPELEP